MQQIITMSVLKSVPYPITLTSQPRNVSLAVQTHITTTCKTTPANCAQRYACLALCMMFAQHALQVVSWRMVDVS